MKIGALGKFWFDDSCSDEELSAIRPLLEKHQGLIPHWCESIHVMCHSHDPDAAGCTCQIRTEEEYRRAHLTFFGAWLGEPPEYREQAVIHELLHLYTEATRVFAADLIRMYAADNETLRKYLFEQMRKQNETTTEDLTLMLVRTGRA